MFVTVVEGVAVSVGDKVGVVETVTVLVGVGVGETVTVFVTVVEGEAVSVGDKVGVVETVTVLVGVGVGEAVAVGVFETDGLMPLVFVGAGPENVGLAGLLLLEQAICIVAAQKNMPRMDK